MNNPALMHPLIYYVEAARTQLGSMRPDDPDEADFWDGLTEAATQLRTAAAEGGVAVAWINPNKLALLQNGWSTTVYGPQWKETERPTLSEAVPLYLHPPTDSGAGRDWIIPMEPTAAMIAAYTALDYNQLVEFNYYGGMTGWDITVTEKGARTAWKAMAGAAIAGAAGEKG